MNASKTGSRYNPIATDAIINARHIHLLSLDSDFTKNPLQLPFMSNLPIPAISDNNRMFRHLSGVFKEI
jgi:hypothetical protein